MSPHAAGARALYELGVKDGSPGLVLTVLAGIGLAAVGLEGWKRLQAWQAERQAQAQAALPATDQMSNEWLNRYGYPSAYGSLADLLR